MEWPSWACFLIQAEETICFLWESQAVNFFFFFLFLLPNGDPELHGHTPMLAYKSHWKSYSLKLYLKIKVDDHEYVRAQYPKVSQNVSHSLFISPLNYKCFTLFLLFTRFFFLSFFYFLIRNREREVTKHILFKYT